MVDNNQLWATCVTTRNQLGIPGISPIDILCRAPGSRNFDSPATCETASTDMVSVAILCLPGARGLRPGRHSFNFGDRSDFALYLWDFRSCTGFDYPPPPRILFRMEMALDHPRNTLHVHRSLEHIILVLLPHTQTDRCQTVSSHLVDAI